MVHEKYEYQPDPEETEQERLHRILKEAEEKSEEMMREEQLRELLGVDEDDPDDDA